MILLILGSALGVIPGKHRKSAQVIGNRGVVLSSGAKERKRVRRRVWMGVERDTGSGYRRDWRQVVLVKHVTFYHELCVFVK